MAARNSDKTVVDALPPRIHVDEFLRDKGFSKEYIAGFHAYVGKVVWRRPDEWEATLLEYPERKID